MQPALCDLDNIDNARAVRIIYTADRAIASAIRSCIRNGGKPRLEMRLSPVRASGGEGGGEGGTEDDTGIHFEGGE